MAHNAFIAMELPHLTAYLRRLRRLSARPTILVSAGWLVLVIGSMVFPLMYYPWADGLSAAIVIVGRFSVYWILAQSMSLLAAEGGRGEPSWYHTLLPDRRALAGVLATALLAALPPYIGLLAYMPLHSMQTMGFYGEGFGGGWQFGSDGYSFYLVVLQEFLRLGAFALAAGCLALACRHWRQAYVLPPLLALAATVAAFFDVAGLSRIASARTVQVQVVGASLTWVVLSLGFALTLLAAALVRRGAARQGFSLEAALAVVLLIGFPLLCGAFGIYDWIEIRNYYYAGWHQASPGKLELLASLRNAFGGVQAHLASYLPDAFLAYSAKSAGEYWYNVEPAQRTMLITLHSPLWLLVLLLLAGSALATWLWWWTALACLRAARHPGAAGRPIPGGDKLRPY